MLRKGCAKVLIGVCTLHNVQCVVSASLYDDGDVASLARTNER